MITVNANTRIAQVLREHPAALETIISISPRFEKLRNPLLRKLMAARTSIAMACRIGGCTVSEFLDRLSSLGFIVDREMGSPEVTGEMADAATTGEPRISEKAGKPAGGSLAPAFLGGIDTRHVTELDVRPILEAGQDPLRQILAVIGSLGPGMVLKIVNSFTPTPLVLLLEKKGFDAWSNYVSNDEIHTYFYRRGEAYPVIAAKPVPASDDWHAAVERFGEKQLTIDVRDLPMPVPMLTILENLDSLSAGHALFVHHKRIPVFLLPELSEKGFEYRIREIREGEVDLLIFKKTIP